GDRGMNRQIVWTIAGSDPGGGAGIQADLKTMNSLGVHGCAVIAALTAQNTTRVSRIEIPSPDMVRDQIRELKDDLPPAAIKIGMLGSQENISLISNELNSIHSFILYDPVMISTSGEALFPLEAIQTLKQQLFPHVDLLTPNIREAGLILGRSISSSADVESAAKAILKFGVKSVLIKGGDREGEFAQDFWTGGRSQWWFTSPKIKTKNTHGTGCTFSSAIVSAIALGFELLNAIVIAKAYVNQGLRTNQNLGHGVGPLNHGGWPETQEDLPWLTHTDESGRERTEFPCSESLGFYPIVDSFEWLKRLLPQGVKAVQLRIKNLQGRSLEDEIKKSIEYARQFNCRLFINDYWGLALEYGAYGVHLGQEDIEKADLKTLAASNIRLGISTHSYAEVARAHAIRPSYMAIGPIFPTTSKPMRFQPQGLEALARWRRTLRYPLVAIGGISLERASDVLRAGADSIAVITAVTNSENPEEETRKWLKLFPREIVSLHS
ncbi:MAG TPA: bifunctional hydroxymethylpyrimidine kinase/phosphomethylpyrimidine kinase, partial [Bdellovibrionota bacterium]|nr:bifunctional hydroxymethylpyrimidine kinase/phosphomethylpyrimidine kinase [Bdellovibrionota bacterium]